MPLYGNHAPREREYLFIDGGSLQASVRKISGGLFGDAKAYFPLVSALATGQFDKIFYYDAVPGKEYGEAQAAYEARVQQDHDRFDQIQALDRVHVALGRIVGRDRRQKGVDVRLAVDMMTYAFRGNISRVTLFAGDADFVPLLNALVVLGLHVTLWHPPQANAELKGAADGTRAFSFKNDHQCFTADGKQSAFFTSSSSSGAIHPSTDALTNIVTLGDHQFAGRWQDDTLKLWRCEGAQHWSSITFHAPGSSLAQALIAADEIYAWGVAATGEQWIQV